jgi:hypothetical protein
MLRALTVKPSLPLMLSPQLLLRQPRNHLPRTWSQQKRVNPDARLLVAGEELRDLFITNESRCRLNVGILAPQRLSQAQALADGEAQRLPSGPRLTPDAPR